MNFMNYLKENQKRRNNKNMSAINFCPKDGTLADGLIASCSLCGERMYRVVDRWTPRFNLKGEYIGYSAFYDIVYEEDKKHLEFG